MDDLTDAVLRAPHGGNEQYAYVADGRGDPLTLWTYTVADGFLAIEERPRSHVADWERVEALPDAIMEQVSGDEHPGAE